ncbi:MAG: hypothetical protein ABI559_03645 [Chloroflexota bacterium]
MSSPSPSGSHGSMLLPKPTAREKLFSAGDHPFDVGVFASEARQPEGHDLIADKLVYYGVVAREDICGNRVEVVEVCGDIRGRA